MFKLSISTSTLCCCCGNVPVSLKSNLPLLVSNLRASVTVCCKSQIMMMYDINTYVNNKSIMYLYICCTCIVPYVHTHGIMCRHN